MNGITLAIIWIGIGVGAVISVIMLAQARVADARFDRDPS